MVYFSLLKLKYSQHIQDLAQKHIFHINKEGFLPAFRDAFFNMFMTENCQKAFKALGLVPINTQVVLDCLEVWLCTPPASLLQEMLWQSKTPSNTYEFRSQFKLICESFT